MKGLQTFAGTISASSEHRIGFAGVKIIEKWSEEEKVNANFYPSIECCWWKIVEFLLSGKWWLRYKYPIYTFYIYCIMLHVRTYICGSFTCSNGIHDEGKRIIIRMYIIISQFDEHKFAVWWTEHQFVRHSLFTGSKSIMRKSYIVASSWAKQFRLHCNKKVIRKQENMKNMISKIDIAIYPNH